MVRAGTEGREASLALGQPFFAPKAGRARVGVWLTDQSSWDEIKELVTESYRILTPRKLQHSLQGMHWTSSLDCLCHCDPANERIADTAVFDTASCFRTSPSVFRRQPLSNEHCRALSLSANRLVRAEHRRHGIM